jgi:hypothetical protein
MKFFTRELYRRCRSSDEDVVDAASAEWEQANERYEQHLREVEARMPPEVREMTSLLLHDARVQAIAQRGSRLLMVLQKDVPPRDLVFLDYELDGEPALEPFLDSPRDWARPTDFQFDEVGVDEQGGRPVFTQSIVFGNGWLLRLRFRGVKVTLASPVVPVPQGQALPLPLAHPA